MGKPISFDELPSTEHAHEFVGAEHGDVPFSVILIHAAPGAGPLLHRHPYAEVFVIGSGTATLRNTGTSELRMTSIHGAANFDTQWLSGDDRVWASRPRRS
jgi:hypothetical protein